MSTSIVSCCVVGFCYFFATNEENFIVVKIVASTRCCYRSSIRIGAVVNERLPI